MPMTRSTMAAALSTGTNRHPPRITSLSLARNHALFPLALATATTAAAAALLYRIDALGSVGRRIRAVPPAVYDRLVLHMTEVWYRAVLERLEDGSAVLDVGIGTAGALLRCKDLIISKRLRIIGVDYNDLYISAAREAITREGLDGRVRVVCMSVYDAEGLRGLADSLPAPPEAESSRSDGGGVDDGSRRPVRFDAVYFSGSFSLLPSPSEALDAVSSDDVLRRGGRAGKVYITQTYQRRSPPLFGIIKPLIKYATTIDFGRLIPAAEVLEVYRTSKRLEVEEHGVMEGSVDNYWQAAYLSVLRRREQ
mmetsp:Transcript_20364/g.58891  ORF Transcript_20364/g.58891 Transcript_20364/m.58891 type:complete len:309 (-) Transcript_20364:1534-2460(-)